jgi:hypothetical protein
MSAIIECISGKATYNFLIRPSIIFLLHQVAIFIELRCIIIPDNQQALVNIVVLLLQLQIYLHLGERQSIESIGLVAVDDGGVLMSDFFDIAL